MAKEVVVLDVNSSIPNQLTLHYVIWLANAKPIPKPSAQSLWTGASAAENSALQAGTVIEESYFVTFPQSIGTAAMKIYMQDHYNDRQAYFNSQLQPGTFYGVFFDPSSGGWSA